MTIIYKLSVLRGQRLMQRKSIVAIANKELTEFNMDPSRLNELRRLRKQSRANNSMHKRKSVSTTQLNELSGGLNGMNGFQIDRSRRPTLVLPGDFLCPNQDNTGDDDEDIEVKIMRRYSNMSQRRVSHSGRRGSTVFNFDPSQLPQVEKANLTAKPRKSALRIRQPDSNNDLSIPTQLNVY